jgi:hypothetical protein
MADSFKEKREKAASKHMSQIEIDAQQMREKMARLRELRLAHEAANPSAKPAPRKQAAARQTSSKKKPAKSSAQAQSLADWLDAQQNQGRRS